MPRKQVKLTQYRVSIPADDPVANEWCKNQRRELSTSIRVLIHRQAKRTGTRNLFSTMTTDLNELNEATTPKVPANNLKTESASQQPAPKKTKSTTQTEKPSDNTTDFPDVDDDLNDIRNMMD